MRHRRRTAMRMVTTRMTMTTRRTMGTNTTMVTGTCTAPTATTITEEAESLPRVLKPAAPTSATALLQLMWLASPALPVGGFSYSEALESAVDAGRVSGEAEAAGWLLDQLHLGLARSDLPVVADALLAWQRGDLESVAAHNDWVTVTRETHESLQQTQQMGRSMLEWLRNRAGDDHRVAMLATLAPAPAWPVAFALAAARPGAPVRDAL